MSEAVDLAVRCMVHLAGSDWRSLRDLLCGLGVLLVALGIRA